MSNDYFRQMLMQAATGHGSGSGETPMLTPQSVENTQKAMKEVEALKNIENQAISLGRIKADDPVYEFLKALYISDAKTREGQVKALNLAIFTTAKLNQSFKIEKK